MPFKVTASKEVRMLGKTRRRTVMSGRAAVTLEFGGEAIYLDCLPPEIEHDDRLVKVEVSDEEVTASGCELVRLAENGADVCTGAAARAELLRRSTADALQARTADDLIAFLNELVELDPVALGNLLEQRVPCNDALRAHPTVQVGEFEGSRVGLLGILNGFCGTIAEGKRAGWGRIAAILDDNGRLMKFSRTEEPMPVLPEPEGPQQTPSDKPVQLVSPKAGPNKGGKAKK